MKTNITIVGYGTMGKSIAKVLSKDSLIKIFIINANGKNTSSIKKSDFILLSVKPQDGEEALKQLKSYGLNKNTILISIMAGFPIKKIINISGHKKIIRMMPNLGLSIEKGIAAWKKTGLSKVESKKTEKIISKITENFEVKNEDDINKVTAISGSGPAYFFLLAKSMMDSAVNLGLKKEEARKLVEKTFSASSILSTGAEYLELVKKVASKGGTTEAALKVFKARNFDKIVKEAVKAAYKKARNI